jgi:hypothetical protein
MRLITGFLADLIAEGVLWSIGAIIKKALRCPLSEAGRSEQTLGLVVILAVVGVILLAGLGMNRA